MFFERAVVWCVLFSRRLYILMYNNVSNIGVIVGTLQGAIAQLSVAVADCRKQIDGIRTESLKQADVEEIVRAKIEERMSSCSTTTEQLHTAFDAPPPPPPEDKEPLPKKPTTAKKGGSVRGRKASSTSIGGGSSASIDIA
jgi:hypothetical protein